MEILNANDRTTYMTDLDKCQKKMMEKGYTDQFQATDEGLKSINTEKVYAPDEVEVPDFFRFEGVSDPDDMSILYLIQTNDGRKGTLVDAYGLYSDDNVSKFMLDVENIKKKVTKR
ncbi:MAG TPA: hypothetical protein VD996_18005 [Chitinophagaceae bacterium]|nr:hypothetical protein [Chitinophagaceae bacterium]